MENSFADIFAERFVQMREELDKLKIENESLRKRNEEIENLLRECESSPRDNQHIPFRVIEKGSGSTGEDKSGNAGC